MNGRLYAVLLGADIVGPFALAVDGFGAVAFVVEDYFFGVGAAYLELLGRAVHIEVKL